MKNIQTKYGSSYPDLPPAFDRRRRERIALHLPLRILSYGLLMESCDDAICTDLSEGGVAFDCGSQLDVGEIIVLEFHQKGETPYRCHARLNYRMGRRYGANFLMGE